MQDAEIAEQFGAVGIGFGVPDRLLPGVEMVEPARRRREPGVDPRDRPPVGFVLPVGGAVGRARGQLLQCRRYADQPAVERQLAAEPVQFVEIVFEDTGALRVQCGAQHALVDERIAVAIAADPASHPQERGEAIGRRHALTG